MEVLKRGHETLAKQRHMSLGRLALADHQDFHIRYGGLVVFPTMLSRRMNGLADGIYSQGATGLRLGGIDVAEAVNSANLHA